MHRNASPDLKKFYLELSLHKMHKEGVKKSDLGLDNSSKRNLLIPNKQANRIYAQLAQYSW